MRESISVDDFRAKYCDSCYWQSQGKCDIAWVKLRYCVNARVDKLTLEVLEEGER